MGATRFLPPDAPDRAPGQGPEGALAGETPARRLLGSLLAALPDAAAALDDDGRAVAWNGPFRALWRLSDEDLRSASLAVRLRPRLRNPAALPEPAAQARTEPRAAAPVILEHVDGSRVELVDAPLDDGTGKLRLWQFRLPAAPSNEPHAPQFVEALASIGDAVVVYDAEHRLVYSNHAFRETFRRIGTRLRPGIHVLDVFRAMVEAGYIAASDFAPDQFPSERVLRNTRMPADGKGPSEWHLLDGRCLEAFQRPTSGGGRLLVFTDVTARKADEAALSATRERAAALQARIIEAIEAMPAGFSIYGPDRRLLASNSEARRIFRRAAHAMVPGAEAVEVMRALQEHGYIGPQAPPVETLVEALFAPGSRTIEVEHATDDGIWLRTIQRPMADGGCTITVMDLTDRRQRELALEEAERAADLARAQLLDAVESMDADFTLFDRDRRLVLANSRVMRRFPEGSPLIQPGAALDDFLAAVVSPSTQPDRLTRLLDNNERIFAGDPTNFVSDDLLVDGTWIRGTARKTSAGGLVSIATDITEERRRQAALEAAEREAADARALLLDAVESMKDGFLLIDRDARKVLCNAAFQELFPLVPALPEPGAPVSALARCLARAGYIDLSRPETRACFSPRAAPTGEPVGEAEIELLDGRWLRVATRRTAEDGYVAIVTDITERHERERALANALRESAAREKELSQIHANIPCVVNRQWTDADGRLLRSAISTRATEFFGIDAAEFGESGAFMQRVPPEDRERLQAELREHHRENRIWTTEYRCRVEDRMLWLRYIGAPTPLDDGTTMWDSVTIEITERKEAELALEQARLGAEAARAEAIRAQQWLEDAVNCSSETITIFDRDERIVLQNSILHQLDPRFAEISWVGMTFEQTMREMYARGMLPPPTQDLESVIAKRVAIFRACSKPVEFRLANGRWARATERRMRDGGTVGMMVDITGLKEREERLRSAMVEVTLASKAKSEFLANMSHELRTPLNAIIGFGEMMEQELLGPLPNDRYRSYVRDIRSSGQHLLEIINTVLDLSRIEAREIKLQEEPVRPEALLEACLPLIRHRATRAAVNLGTALPHDLPLVFADPMRLRQVLLNLLSNAVKFTEPGGSVTVSAGRRPDGALAIAVHDTGIGMSDEQVARVFEPFFQVEGPMARRSDGTGLGLSLSRALMQEHDGRLEIVSAIGQGTTASMVLPASRVLGPPPG